MKSDHSIFTGGPRTNGDPLLSVVMPVYNQEKYVLEAINSILNQTFTHFEFIVVDDGSTDRTPEILSTVKDSRFRYVLGSHVGFIRTLARGYEEARGQWIARMDSDDVSHPQRLQLQMDFLAAHPECVFVGSAYGFMSPAGFLAAPGEKFEWKYLSPSQITLGGRVFGDPTTVFNRSIASEVGFYDPEFENENPLWYRLMARGKGAVLGRPLYFNRWRLGSLSQSNFYTNQRAHMAIRQRYDGENTPPVNEHLSFDEKATLLTKAKLGVFLYLAAGDQAAARKLAIDLWRRWPTDLLAVRLVVHALLGVERFRFWQRRRTPWYVRVEPSQLSET